MKKNKIRQQQAQPKISKVDDRQAEVKYIHKQNYEQSMKFTRYLYIRYFLAILFFFNLHWLATLMLDPKIFIIIPLAIIMLIFITYFNIMKLQNNPEASTKILKYFFKINATVTVLEIVGVWINCHYFFPYIQDGIKNQGIMTAALGGSILLSLWAIKHINRVVNKQDMISKRLLKLEECNIQ